MQFSANVYLQIFFFENQEDWTLIHFMKENEHTQVSWWVRCCQTLHIQPTQFQNDRLLISNLRHLLTTH